MTAPADVESFKNNSTDGWDDEDWSPIETTDSEKQVGKIGNGATTWCISTFPLKKRE